MVKALKVPESSASQTPVVFFSLSHVVLDLVICALLSKKYLANSQKEVGPYLQSVHPIGPNPTTTQNPVVGLDGIGLETIQGLIM